MTPDAVIHRYLQLIAQPRVDLAELCTLIAVDADLLARWLRLFNCPADPRTLHAEMAALSSAEFNALAQAQAWFVSSVTSGARLSLEQWQAVLGAACLAEVLHEASATNDETLVPNDDPGDTSTTTDLEDDVADNVADNVRTRALLALSGVNLDADKTLADMINYRGIAPALLEDASLELKIFAVVDGIETGHEVELASQLLGLDASMFEWLVAQAQTRTSEAIDEAGVDFAPDVDWARRNWLRQQIAVACACFADANTPEAIQAAHATVSRTLFGEIPELLLVHAGNLVASIHSTLVISQSSQTSKISHCIQELEPVGLSNSLELAVVDRQILGTLGAEEGIALPIQAQQPLAVLVVKVDDEVDIDYAAGVYAEELSKWLAPQPPGESALSNEVDRFRAAEIQRLREVVHEANNPLSIVYNYLHILELRMQGDAEVSEQLDMIGRELRRAGEVIASARNVPDITAANLTTVDQTSEFNLIETVRRTGELHRGFAQERGVTVHIALDDEELMLASDESKLIQIVSNLVKNAIEACESGDDVLLRSRRNIYRDGKLGVEIIVQDSGPGINNDVLDVLFEPKESTKGGEHQGLGLHLAYRLINELSGSLDVRTTPGDGSAFHIYLPLSASTLD